MSEKYDLYLADHRIGVNNGFDFFLQFAYDEVMKAASPDKVDIVHQILFEHDASKSSSDEYDTYDEYFYGPNKSHKVVQAFDYAWLHHIHNNPHHWQYWVLLEDDPTGSERFKALDMPDNYILEMVCDWWSFSWKARKLDEIFDWYGKHRDKMILSEATRRKVENWLDIIRTNIEDEANTDKIALMMEERSTT